MSVSFTMFGFMNQICPLKRSYVSTFKQTAESKMLKSRTLFHYRLAFVLFKVSASLLPCLLLSWPWVSQHQTMTQVLCLDFQGKLSVSHVLCDSWQLQQWEEFKHLKKCVGYYCNCC